MTTTRKKFKILTLITGLLVFFQAAMVFAATSTFSQTISDGSLSIDIVDADGVTVETPGVTFEGKSFAFTSQTATGTLGEAAQRIRVYNPTATAAWTASIAATDGPTALWTTGSVTYDFNDTNSDGTDNADDNDTKGGRLTVDPSAGTVAGVSGCSTSNVSKGSSNSFQEATSPISSITLFSSTTAATYCRWDLTGVSLSQVIPASQASGAYTLGFTITVS